MYTRYLVVPPDLMARFANDPFAVIRAALVAGKLEPLDPVPQRLDPLLLAGGTKAVDQVLLAKLAANPGGAKLARLVDSALEARQLMINGTPSPEELIAGVITCVPPELRTKMSFTTGLKHSSRRPFRLGALSGDKAELRWIANQPNVTIADLEQRGSEESMSLCNWARLIQRVLTSGRTSFLASRLAERRPDLTADDLSALALQLFEEFDVATLHSENNVGGSFSSPTGCTNGQEAIERRANANPGASTEHADTFLGASQAHGAHRRFQKTVTAAKRGRGIVGPSETLDVMSREVLDKLERLDDAVYEAIDGEAEAFEQLKELWPEVLAGIGEDLVAESREQYLHYALRIWEESIEDHAPRPPAKAVHALDVLCLLFDEFE